MVETVPKSPELVQAQIATFAAEHVEYFEDRRHIFDNIGSLAVEGVGDIKRVTTDTEYHKGDDGDNSLRVPEGTERTVATGAEYTDFLRSVGGSHNEAIQGRAEMLQAYSRFEPTIVRLRSELADPATRKEHPNYLGHGSNSTVFSIEDDDKRYAVRVPNGFGVSAAAIDSHLAGAVLGKGVPHLEQIVAASYKDCVTVAEMMPGQEMGDLTVEDLSGISDEQLGELVDTLSEVNRRGIEIDPKPSNIFYDHESGFGIVDYHSSKVAGKSSADQDLGSIVGWMATDIDNAGLYGKPYKSEKTTEDYANELEFRKAHSGVLKRYRAVVEAKLTGEDQEKALAEIDKHITSTKEAIDNYSNPQWVAERVEQEQEWKRQREERAKQPATTGWDLV